MNSNKDWWKSQRRGDSRVIIVSEKLTTKTCGLIKEDVGEDEIYHCSTCGLVVDRDVNAARNILIRYIRFCDTRHRIYLISNGID